MKYLRRQWRNWRQSDTIIGLQICFNLSGSTPVRILICFLFVHFCNLYKFCECFIYGVSGKRLTDWFIYWLITVNYLCESQAEIMWHHTIVLEMHKINHSWDSLQEVAKDRQKWHVFVVAQTSSWCTG